ncbi:ATP-dependent endonuclease [Pseudonocardia sp. N23]|uniref:ATP-dependent nuclease n=1 Tax=Pseudonocardia sp. N23 TaxID=1987376 RepID=UPI000BFD6EBD|nr:AAA family ATPase [Pseudonocardia sp. N23]GAY11767.1 predicted ATP-dependent endonuclease, OLD family [Pseudonocardia sp. N23]
MKISAVAVRHYRCLKEVRIDVDDYTALVGPNGSGKSSILYALDWFFNGRPIDASDLCRYIDAGASAGEVYIGSDGADESITVEVTFTDLNDEDRKVLEKYGRGRDAVFRKSWSRATGKEKLIGNSRQGPGFAEVRNLTRIADIRKAYGELRGKFPTLVHVIAKDAILGELAKWEDDPANSAHLVSVDDADANHMMGVHGEHALAKRIRFVLVPAATDIAQQIGAPGKGSALTELVGSLMAEAVAAARADWEAEFSPVIAKLRSEIEKRVDDSTAVQARRVSHRLNDLIPDAKIVFRPQVDAWTLRGDSSIATDVIIDGMAHDVSRQGHGVQRAVIIAMLQSLVPDGTLATDQFSHDASDLDQGAQARFSAELADLPALVVGIEEPEIYQHPVRARNFGRVLFALSCRPDSQVVVATHSPYFVRPEQFAALRRLRVSDGCAVVSSTTLDGVAAVADVDSAKVLKTVERMLPNAFSEGFFAEAVVLVEGDTDRVVVEAIAEKLRMPLDSHGIAVLAMGGKESLRIPYSILESLGVPVYVVVDGDSGGAARKNPGNVSAQEKGNTSRKESTETVLSWLPEADVVVGDLPYSYGNPSVVANRYTFLCDDLEEELRAWPSFCTALTAAGGALRQKNVSEYRSAAIDAEVSDLPVILRECISAIIAFRSEVAGVLPQR